MNDFWILYLAVYIDDSPIPLALSSFSAASLFGSCSSRCFSSSSSMVGLQNQ